MLKDSFRQIYRFIIILHCSPHLSHFLYWSQSDSLCSLPPLPPSPLLRSPTLPVEKTKQTRRLLTDSETRTIRCFWVSQRQRKRNILFIIYLNQPFPLILNFTVSELKLFTRSDLKQRSNIQHTIPELWPTVWLVWAIKCWSVFLQMSCFVH